MWQLSWGASERIVRTPFPFSPFLQFYFLASQSSWCVHVCSSQHRLKLRKDAAEKAGKTEDTPEVPKRPRQSKTGTSNDGTHGWDPADNSESESDESMRIYNIPEDILDNSYNRGKLANIGEVCACYCCGDKCWHSFHVCAGNMATLAASQERHRIEET